MAQLRIISGALVGRKFALPPEGILIGRHADCALVLNDIQASSRHARLSLENSRWILHDLQSSNGTLVNGTLIETIPLADGDIVTIGETEMKFSAKTTDSISIVRDKPRPEPAPHAAEAHHAAPAVSPATAEDLQLVEHMSAHTQAIRREVAKVVIGQAAVLDEVLMCMIANGHALLVGLPGLAKTLMIRTIAQVLDLEFKRIQFTPDLMPSDITGTEILETNRDTQEKEFRFIQGPIFCNLLLADEINRTPPKTQASLLEAMQERHVTAGNRTFVLDKPFFVLATQNPIEQEGTYPLPEAQMDRFMFNIWVDYPSEAEEEMIVASTTMSSASEPQKVLSKANVLQLQDVVRKIPVSEHVIKYAIRLVRATRPGVEGAPGFVKEFVSTGAGPRAGQSLIMAAKARAVLEGRIHVSCSDVRSAAIPVLRHRIYTNFAADSEGINSMTLIHRLLEAVEEPSEKDYGATR